MTEQSATLPRLLLVEDNPDHLDILQLILQDMGFGSIATAVDGEDALQRLNTEHHGIELIIMDLKMPRMGGLETLIRLKGNALTRELPVIILTTSSSQEEIKRCMIAGALGFLTKPLIPEELNELLRLAAKMSEGLPPSSPQ
ncbi:MAG: response regulator [Hahellaceae bacterium]|nr:response regulator [Hahellaceae bacterium]